MTKKIAIVGAGPAGCACAYFLGKDYTVTLFEAKVPLHTLLYTGGGRCNLAHGEFDFKELAKNYPRGEKFLYSVFSKFSTAETLSFFAEIGVKSYMQDDYRFFPVSDSAKEVRQSLLDAISHHRIVKERVLLVEKGEKDYFLSTEGGSYHFDAVVIATGGRAGYVFAEKFGHKIVSPKPALVGLITSKSFSDISGVSLKNIGADIFFEGKKVLSLVDDVLFTHKGISGPLAYKISSLCARLPYKVQNPLKIKLNLLGHAEFISASNQSPSDGKILNQVQDDVRSEKEGLQALLDKNSKKDIKNLVSDFIPKSFAEFILKHNNIDSDTKCHQIDSKKRDLIDKSLMYFEVNVISSAKEGEVVTSGGVCLDEINSKTMESKLLKGLYFIGEVIDVDGFCGGFNLQNCWSTAYVAAEGINKEG